MVKQHLTIFIFFITNLFFSEHKDKFYWFDHTWRHYKTNLLDEKSLRKQFSDNRKFAKFYNIPIDYNYSVTPHHSGIFPVYPVLYKLWSEEFSIKATSTESYPHQNPIYLRRGFIYNNVMVAPRQSSGVFTTSIKFRSNEDVKYYISKYAGGALFETMLYNELSIFMTHFGNYANDRLANFLFENVFTFISCWTNLRFYSLPPYQMVQKYFELNPNENELTWTVRKYFLTVFFLNT